MILNEFDAYREALKKVNLNEEVMPYVRGKLLTENVEIYAKIQKILACPAMEQCHRYLYDLDVENLNEAECNTVNNLFKLGCERGCLSDDTVGSDITVTDTANVAPDLSADTTPVTEPAPIATPAVTQAPQTAYTVIYSATRNGEIKTGEAYSNAVNTRSAKADILSQLEKAGYQNVSILAIEAGDPDMTGCDNTFVKQSDYVAPTYEEDAEEDTEETATTTNDVTEADDAEDSADKEDDKSKEDKSEDKSEDKEDDKSKEDKSEDAPEETAEEPDEKLKDDSADSDEEKELSDAEKAQFKDQYKKAFKAAMVKCKYFDKAFNDLTLEEKVEFFTQLSNAWSSSKADPTKFMTDKEIEQLEKIVIKKQ